MASESVKCYSRDVVLQI